MTETKPKHRWFRFSLRTLFVVVTLFCIWLGKQVNLVTQRREFIHMLDLVSPQKWHYLTTDHFSTYPLPNRQVPIVARILGEHAYSCVWLPEWYSQDLIDKAAYLFPEAQINRWTTDTIEGKEFVWLKDVTRY